MSGVLGNPLESPSAGNGDLVAAWIMVILMVVVAATLFAWAQASQRRRQRADAAAAARRRVDDRLRTRRIHGAPAPSTHCQCCSVYGQGGAAAREDARAQDLAAPTVSATAQSFSHIPPMPRVAPPPAPESAREPRIVTRTGPTSDRPLRDDFALYGERTFTPEEDKRILRHYMEGSKIIGIAEATRLDQKQVAARLIRLLFDTQGRIDTDDEAPRSGHRYTRDDLERMREAYHDGVPLERLADELGRSPLGLGWQMIDRQIPKVPDPLRERVRRDR